MSDAQEISEGSASDHLDDVASARAGSAPVEFGTKPPHRFGGNVILGAALLLLLPGSLVAGALRHHETVRGVAATAEQQRSLVPNVRVAAVRPSDGMMTVSLPATTTAFEAANIFARTSGYIEKRYVDIGDRVKAGTLLAEIIAPELDHQISEAQATLKQAEADFKRQTDLVAKQAVSVATLDTSTSTRDNAQASLQQAQANTRIAAVN